MKEVFQEAVIENYYLLIEDFVDVSVINFKEENFDFDKVINNEKEGDEKNYYVIVYYQISIIIGEFLKKT